MPDLLSELRVHLAAEDIVRPTVAGEPAELPPLHLEPFKGIPAPGEGNIAERHASAVLGAYVTGGIPPNAYESWQRRTIVDIRFRVRSTLVARAIEEDIRAALIDKRNWMMGELKVIESEVWREFQPLGTDSQSADFVVAYVFQLYSGDQASLP